MRRLFLPGVGLVIIVVFFALMGSRMSMKTVKEIDKSVSWSSDNDISKSVNKLVRLRVFFGHQSVGQDIVDGIVGIIENEPECWLKVYDQNFIEDSTHGVLYHSKIGRNTRPESKIRAFKKIITESMGDNVEIAFMKFCYVDITRDSNPEELFNLYSTEMAGLRDRFPSTVFVHVTVPIESMPRSWEGVLKHVVKRMVGKPGVLEDNSARHHFNELMRNHYAGKEPVFDLAAWESLDSEGNSTIRVFGGERVPFMDSRKTHDGGHLNEAGRKALGRELLAFLAGIERDRR